MATEDIKRKFHIEKSSFEKSNVGKHMSFIYEEEVLKVLKKESSLFAILAKGGMGKSYLAEKWSKKLSMKRVEAQTVNKEEIQENIILDNIDEVSSHRVSQLLDWISEKKIKKLIIFSRPENITSKNALFKKISFENFDDEIPRYTREYNMDVFSIRKFNKLLDEKFNISEMELDFLSILSFKLMVSGTIHIDKFELFEFMRKYNINNSSNIKTSDLLKKDIFKEVEDNIYFVNKTLPSFFVINFLRKFSKVKNSYLIKYSDFKSQLTFVETVLMLKSLPDDEYLKLGWELVLNNNFFFPFLQKYEFATGLGRIFKYGSKNISKQKFTTLVAKTQIHCSNDVNFNGSIYFYPKYKMHKLLKNELYIKLINNGIKEDESRKRALGLHFKMLEAASVQDEEYSKVLIDCAASVNYKELKNVSLDRYSKFSGVEYMLGFIKLKEIKDIDFYNYSGPIEASISYGLKFDYKKAFNLIKYFNFKKIWTGMENIEFLNWLVKTKKFTFLMDYLRRLEEPTEKNELFIKQIPNAEIEKYISTIGFKHSKIIISNAMHEKLKKDLGKNRIYLSQLFEIEFVQPTPKQEEFDNKQIQKDIKIAFEQLEFSNMQIYYMKNHEYHNIIKEAKYEEISIDFIEKYLKDIYDLFEKEYQYSSIARITEPIIQIFAKCNPDFIKNTVDLIHPILLMKINSFKSYNRSECQWYSDFDEYSIRKSVLKWLSKENVLKVIQQQEDHMLSDYIYEVLEKTEHKEREGVIKALSTKALQDWWWSIFDKYYETSNEAQQAAKKLGWKPENFNDLTNKKYSLWSKMNSISKNKIDKFIKDMFKNDFRLFKKQGHLGSYSIEWYDRYFGFMEEDRVAKIRNTMSFLESVGKVEVFKNEMKSRFYEEFNKELHDARHVIWIYSEWLFAFSFSLENFHIQKEFSEMIEKFPKYKSTLERIYTIKVGHCIEVQANSNFNILNFYKYLNDDLSINEFHDLYISEIIPLMKKTGRIVRGMSKEKFETNVQNQILKRLPKILMSQYGIIMQHESNTFNFSNRKRIDLIFSKNDKYLFVELKSSNDSRLLNNKEMSQQLQSYDNSYNLRAIKILTIFEIHNLREKSKDKIKNYTHANDFKVNYIDLNN